MCLDAGSSTRTPGVCPVSRQRRTHARVRRRREPDANTLNSTLMTLELTQNSGGFQMKRRDCFLRLRPDLPKRSTEF